MPEDSYGSSALPRRAFGMADENRPLQKAPGELRRNSGELNPHIIRPVENYLAEMAPVVPELGRIVRRDVFMVNDNVRYRGIRVPVILPEFAEGAGFRRESMPFRGARGIPANGRVRTGTDPQVRLRADEMSAAEAAVRAKRLAAETKAAGGRDARRLIEREDFPASAYSDRPGIGINEDAWNRVPEMGEEPEMTFARPGMPCRHPTASLRYGGISTLPFKRVGNVMGVDAKKTEGGAPLSGENGEAGVPVQHDLHDNTGLGRLDRAERVPEHTGDSE